MKKQPLVLIVEDSRQNIQLLGKILTDQGYNIGIAKNGKAALKFVRERVPDLVLLDIMLPDIDGYKVCATLKQSVGTRHIPIVFLSMKTKTENIVKGFEVGGVDYVTKPFVTEELLARVKTHIELNILKGLLPICAKCKKVRKDDGLWLQIEEYFEKYTNVNLSHALCENCLDELYGDKDWYREQT